MSKKYTNLIVFIGEGKSERAFISSLLENKYGFIDTRKNNTYLERGKTLFCLAHPKMGACHRGGDCTIYGEDTYKKTRALLISMSKFIFKQPIKITYFILSDIKEESKKVSDSTNYINKHLNSFNGDIVYPFASYEIETWFLASLGDDFKNNHDIDDDLLSGFLREKNIDKISDTKEILDNVLPKNLAKKTSYIGEEFGRYLDIELGKQRSKSFKNFIDQLERLI